jgi:uncharacterized repeat protein (TIGR01451 family)
VPRRLIRSASNYPRQNKVFAQALAGGFSAILVFSALWIGVVAGAGGNPAANLDQCANDPFPSLPTNGCAGVAGETGWVNGNLGASKSIYREGDSIAYRMRFSNLVTFGSDPSVIHHVVIEWDTTKAGKHAIDYLTTWNRTVANSNPCLGVTFATGTCTVGTPSDTEPIPGDPQVTGGAVGGQIPGLFTIWGGQITGISSASPYTHNGYAYPDGSGFTGDKTARLELNFTATVANPVLAWGGHIATRQDWPNASAIQISGSPYHMRLINLDGSGGNQDRSLSADAVVFPAKITVFKDANGSSATFTFNGTDFTPNPFTLTDSSTTTNPSKVSNDIISFGNHTVSESSALPGYALGSIVCSSDMTNTYTPTINAGGAGGSVSINVEEGENISCTFYNLLQTPSLTIDKTVSSVKNPDGTDDSDGKADQAGDVIHYSVLVTNTGNTTLTGVSVSDPLTNGNLDCDSGTAGQQKTGLTIAVGGSITCTGTYTVTQTDLNNNGGGDGDIDNTATADSDQTEPLTDSEAVPVVPAPSLSVSKVDDYDTGEKFENVGDVITYTIVVTNTGNTDLIGVDVTDDQVTNLDCDPDTAGNQTTGFTILVGGSLTCSASHTIDQDDLDAGSFYNQACADDGVGGAASDCDDVTTPGKNQPAIETADTLTPQDSITLSGLTGVTTDGDLYVELRIDEDCGEDLTPAYSKTWLDAGNGVYDTANTVAVSADATIRWCTSYSGDADNAARPLSDRDEVVTVDFFDPVLTGAAIGFAIPLLAWAVWGRRRRSITA